MSTCACEVCEAVREYHAALAAFRGYSHMPAVRSAASEDDRATWCRLAEASSRLSELTKGAVP